MKTWLLGNTEICGCGVLEHPASDINGHTKMRRAEIRCDTRKEWRLVRACRKCAVVSR